MMPDLGSYAVSVLAAYAGTLVLLAAIVILSWARARRVRRRLEGAETRIAAKGSTAAASTEPRR